MADKLELVKWGLIIAGCVVWFVPFLLSCIAWVFRGVGGSAKGVGIALFVIGAVVAVKVSNVEHIELAVLAGTGAVLIGAGLVIAGIVLYCVISAFRDWRYYKKHPRKVTKSITKV